MRKLLIPGLIAASFLFTASTIAQEQKEPEFKLIKFHLALLKRGAKWPAAMNETTRSLHKSHVAYISSLLESGKAVIAGPLTDDGEIRGVVIFRTESAAEARGWAEGDPAVKASHLQIELHPWWSADVMKKSSSLTDLTTSYLAFLTRGAKWTPQQTPETDALQKAHLANINRLAEMKKLVVAGPFADDGELRGIFVFKVASLQEARALADTDPSVQAGRLAISLHPWLVPEGILP